MGVVGRGLALTGSAATAVFALDRLTKIWAETTLKNEPPIEVIPGVLTLLFTRNSGGAFGIGQSSPLFFATASSLISILIVVAALRPRPPLVSVALGSVLGGALGNLADRALNGPGFAGGVTDFIDIRIIPVFNVADTGIVIGALLLVLVAGREPSGTTGDRAMDATSAPDVDDA